jgi:capsular polysaccharide biosynthesis protein
MDLHRMQLNLKIIEDRYKRYLSQLEDIRISEALDLAAISNVTVIEPALVPISPVRKISYIPRRILHILIGTIMGLIVGLGYAFLADYFDHTFKSSHEIEKVLNTTCLASIPREK